MRDAGKTFEVQTIEEVREAMHGDVCYNWHCKKISSHRHILLTSLIVDKVMEKLSNGIVLDGFYHIQDHDICHPHCFFGWICPIGHSLVMSLKMYPTSGNWLKNDSQ